MLVLHSTIASNESFLVWGEVPASVEPGGSEPTAAKAAKTAKGSKGAKGGKGTKTAVAMELPFSATSEQVGSAWRQASGLDGLLENTLLQASVLIPTRADGRPCASSTLIDENYGLSAVVGARPWLVNACQVSLAEFLSVCAELKPDDRRIAHGLVASDDLIFWASVTNFAAGLVFRQRFLPGLLERSGQWYSVWEPVIGGEDLERLSALVDGAPQVCFANPELEGQAGALQIVHNIVAGMVDHLVRQASTEADAAIHVSGKTRTTTAPAAVSTNVHDLWLQSLQSNNGLLALDQTQLQALQTDLARWKRPLNSTINAPFRLCFRLEEPVPLTESDPAYEHLDTIRLSEDLALDERPWHIAYLLQSSHDPSLYFEAAAVWEDAVDSPFLERTAFGAREYLLASLGAASMIYPPVEASLLNARPSSAELTVQEAYQFLSEKANLLQDAGFGVMLPSWWTQPSRRQRLRAGARAASGSKLRASSGKLSANSLVEFRWQVALGEHELSREELEELALMKVPLVKVRGQWIEINPEQLKAAIKFLKTNKQSSTMRDLLQLTIGASQLPAAIQFDGFTGDQRITDVLDQFTGELKFEMVPQPSEFQGTLREYQQRGYSWMNFLGRLGLGACLADDMGLGKTVQTLALLQKYWQETPDTERQPVLLICPMSVVGNWQREAQRFTPQLPVLVHHGADRIRGEEFCNQAAQHAIVLSSYALLGRDIEILKQVPWSGMILDEAQNIKNPSTQQARSARAIHAGYKLALTGTPVENNVGDLWSLMAFLNPGLLGSQTQFKEKFLTPIQVDRDVQATEKLKKIVSPFILRRLKIDRTIIKDLPDKLEMRVFCNLTAEQASLYQAVLHDMEISMQKLDGIERKGLVLATMGKLKQICNHPAQFLHDNSSIDSRSGKVDRLTEMLEEVREAGDCALIFSQFAEMGELLKQHLQDTFGEEVLFLHGAVTKEKRERMVDRFQLDNGPRLFVLSLKAGGVGLNLTRANQVFHFDRWWNPAVENQATDRAFRIGQKKNVQVHKFICIGTLEDKIDQLIQSKQELATSIVGTGEGWLTELSNEQLKELFALGKDAVSE